MMRNKKGGFMLSEVIVTIAIIAIVSAGLTTTYFASARLVKNGQQIRNDIGVAATYIEADLSEDENVDIEYSAVRFVPLSPDSNSAPAVTARLKTVTPTDSAGKNVSDPVALYEIVE